jgi:diguanylate cyclase
MFRAAAIWRRGITTRDGRGEVAPPRRPWPHADRFVRMLGRATWGVVGAWLGASLVVAGLTGSGRPHQGLLVANIAVLFSVLLIRVLIRSWMDHVRRESLLALAGALCLWAAGSAVLNSGPSVADVPFPAPGEGFFLLAYVLFTASVLLDVRLVRLECTIATWLDIAIVCGGIASLTGVLMLIPPLEIFDTVSLALVLAVIYPTLELLLSICIVVQMWRRILTWSRHGVLLAVGFLVLAVADLNFVMNLTAGYYASSHLLDLVYEIGFGAVVAGACSPRAETRQPSARRLSARMLLITSAMALFVLVARPSGGVGFYLTIPAALTLVAVAARFMIALRDSEMVTEALLLSYTDDLTGLPNRRAFDEYLTDAFARQGSLAVMLIDLDHFKEINDSHGHDSGDQVLRAVARRIPSALAEGCTTARLGGDEFALLLPQAEEIELLDCARNIRSAVLPPVAVEAGVTSPSVSIGIAVRESSDHDMMSLMRRADSAMYSAKRSGAGVVLYERN